MHKGLYNNEVIYETYITSWDHGNYRSYPIETTDNIYFEWSKPWSIALRTKLSTNYNINKEDYGLARDIDNAELRVDFETLVRFTPKSFIMLSLGGMRQDMYGYDITYSVMPGAGVNVNIFTFLFIRLDYTSTIPIHGNASHMWSAKIAGQF